MAKKLKIKFWKTEKALAMQIIEQEGLPKRKDNGIVNMLKIPYICEDNVYLRGYDFSKNYYIATCAFDTNHDRDSCLDKITRAITDELFTGDGEPKVEINGEVTTYTWEEE